MVASLDKHPSIDRAENDPKTAARRLAARKAKPDVASPQSEATHDDDKPSGG